LIAIWRCKIEDKLPVVQIWLKSDMVLGWWKLAAEIKEKYGASTI